MFFHCSFILLSVLLLILSVNTYLMTHFQWCQTGGAIHAVVPGALSARLTHVCLHIVMLLCWSLILWLAKLFDRWHTYCTGQWQCALRHMPQGNSGQYRHGRKPSNSVADSQVERAFRYSNFSHEFPHRAKTIEKILTHRKTFRHKKLTNCWQWACFFLLEMSLISMKQFSVTEPHIWNSYHRY